MIATACSGLFRAGQHLKVPQTLDKLAARAGCECIRGYQRWLSAHSGRRCLFRLSCSEFAIRSLREFGWSKGTRLGAERLRRCGGSFSLSRDVQGRVAMVATDGSVFMHEELATWVLRDSPSRSV